FLSIQLKTQSSRYVVPTGRVVVPTGRSRKFGVIWSFGLLRVCKSTKIPFISEDGLAIEWNYKNLTELLKKESDEFILNHEGGKNDSEVISLKGDLTMKVQNKTMDNWLINFVETIKMNVRKATIDMIKGVVKLINNSTLMNTSIFDGFVEMAQHVQNINHSAFKSMFEREKLSGNNFNDWFRQLELVLRVEKKMYVIEQPLPTAPAADSNAQVLVEWNALYDAYNEAACLMLVGVERFDLIQTFHACKQEKGKLVAAYALQMKGYVDQLERFVRNYNMHNMGKTISELHAMLIEYKKGLPKKAKTLQVMMIKGGKIHKSKKKLRKAKVKCKANGKGKDKQAYIPMTKNPKPTAKEHPTKDDTCHHCKEVGHWKMNYPVYLAKLLKKKKQVGFASSSVSKNNVFDINVIPSNGIYEIDMHDLVPNVNSIYNVSTKRAKHNLDSSYLWYCRLAHISKKRIEKLQQEGLLKSIDDESFDQCVSCLSGKMTRKSFPHHLERATDLLGIIHTDVCDPLRHVSRQDRGDEYINQEFKDYLKACGIVQQLTPPYTPQHNGVSERRNHTLLDMVRSMMNLTTLLLSFWDYALESATRILNMVPTNGRAVDLKEIQDEDTSPSEITSKLPMEVEDAMNAEIQSMMDNMVWVLVDLPPGCKSVGSKWIFKKKTDMDGIVHTYKACLVAKGYTQLYEVDYEETLSPVTEIRATRILISIAAFDDYEICQMDVKTAFLNGYLNEDIYMVQPEEAKFRVDCYCDAGFETDRDDTKSQTGYVFILNGGTVD
nr:zinc finger, CCHC-type [Tanacetum cinerariifolium]